MVCMPKILLQFLQSAKKNLLGLFLGYSILQLSGYVGQGFQFLVRKLIARIRNRSNTADQTTESMVTATSNASFRDTMA